jgi:hypothetical protein
VGGSRDLDTDMIAERRAAGGDLVTRLTGCRDHEQRFHALSPVPVGHQGRGPWAASEDRPLRWPAGSGWSGQGACPD